MPFGIKIKPFCFLAYDGYLCFVDRVFLCELKGAGHGVTLPFFVVTSYRSPSSMLLLFTLVPLRRTFRILSSVLRSAIGVTLVSLASVTNLLVSAKMTLLLSSSLHVSKVVRGRAC